jgi:hypothetical protein
MAAGVSDHVRTPYEIAALLDWGLCPHRSSGNNGRE